MDTITLRNIENRLHAIEAQLRSLQAIQPGGSGTHAAAGTTAPTPAATVPEIVDQTGVAGTLGTFLPSDCVPKLKLAGAPAAGTAGNATLEHTADNGGFQVRKAAYSGETGLVGQLDDFADGLGVKLAADSGIKDNNDGLEVEVAAPIKVDANGVGLNVGNGLELSGSDLQIKLNGGTLTLGASGLSVTNPAPSPESETPEAITAGSSGSAGTDADYARGDHTHPWDGYARYKPDPT